MVKPTHIGSFAPHALLYLTSHLTPRADKTTYTTNTIASITSIQTWYNTTTGLWETTGWWNSANILTMLADFAAIDPAQANTLALGTIFLNTFTQAQTAVANATKFRDASGLVQSSYMISMPHYHSQILTTFEDGAARGFPGFLNEYYDDEGWWALALIRLYDVTHHKPYLAAAADIFDDMRTGVDAICGGGSWWSKERTYKNAIANSLFLATAASLANRATALPGNTGVALSDEQSLDSGERRSWYLALADRQWEWFQGSGMINATTGLVNDGLTILESGKCKNNGGEVWSYNQGALIMALAELSAARRCDVELLKVASGLAERAIEHLQRDGDGILRDPCEPKCGADGSQFKGVFMRGLERLWRELGRYEVCKQEVVVDFEEKRERWRRYILKNADSVWEKTRWQNGSFNLVWTGPKEAGDSGPNASTSSSAMEALVAAMAVS